MVTIRPGSSGGSGEHLSRHTRRLLLRAAVLAFFGVLFEWLDLFGVVDASHQASADAFARLTAIFYSDHIPSEPVVIVFDPTSLDAIAKSGIWDDKALAASAGAPPKPQPKAWPLSYRDQARFLRALSGYEPSAIFYDIVFSQYRDRDGLADFAKAIHEVTAATQALPCATGVDKEIRGTPIFLARDFVRTPLEELCLQGAESVETAWEARANIYKPLVCNQPTDDACWGEMPAPRPRGETLAPRPWGEMAAPRLWREWCRHERKSNPNLKDSVCAGSETKENLRPFALIWGAGPDPQEGTYRSADKPCRTALEQVLHDPRSSDRNDPAASCPFQLTIPAANIVLCDNSQSSGCVSRQVLSDRLRNHIVIITASFPGLRDWLATPVHGMLPGAFTHATALDNLMRFGQFHVPIENEESFVGHLLSFALLFACMAAALWLLERIAHRTRPAAVMTEVAQAPGEKLVHRLSVTFEDRVRWLRLAAYSPGPPDRSVRHTSLAALGLLLALGAAMVLTGLAIALIMFFLLHQAPLNWIGLSVLVATLCIDEIAGESTYAIIALVLFYDWGRRATRAFLDPPDEEPEDEDIRDETILEITHEA